MDQQQQQRWQQHHHIDSLLERYLILLDEYSSLREQLSKLQSGVFHDIARANFAGERGMRYGQDHYDERMQAGRLVGIIKDDEEGSTPEYRVAQPGKPMRKPQDEEKEGDKEGEDEGNEADGHDDDGHEAKAEATKPAKPLKDPLRWFGLLAPPALRSAQGQSIQVVEQIIPRLATVHAEMLDVEIQVRRARKKRAKTEASEKKAALGEDTAALKGRSARVGTVS